MKIDDFLDQKEFDELQTLMMSSNFAWFYNDGIDYKNEITDKFQFTHIFYRHDSPHSELHVQLKFILEKLNPISIYQIKANLLTKTPNIIENTFHSDLENILPEEKQKQWTTSIFYVNTNNGYTKFEDGTKVESIANRMITFPTNMKHTGTSCTDENTRVVINFNYFKR